MKSPQGSRHTGTAAWEAAEGWLLERVTPPSRLFGANGLRTGPDGRIYIAQVAGSQISALDVNTGDIETVSAKGSEIIAPDDLAFDSLGNLYATEVMDGRVSVRGADGGTRLLNAALPSANGITVHRDRLFIGECRIGGRLMELDRDGGEPRVILDNQPMLNAMEFGPDGLLYFPVMGTNDIWRIDPDGGEPERVVGDLGVPDSVKFDSEGWIVSTQVGSGEVLRINPRSGERRVLASLAPGLDNCTFVDGRLFISNFTGEITELLSDGETRTMLPGGFCWPLGLAVDGDGELYAADGMHFYRVTGGELETVGMHFLPGYPGYIRGVAAVGPAEFVTTSSNGEIWHYRAATAESEVLAEGLGQLYGVALSPGGDPVAAELDTGRLIRVRSGSAEILASGLHEPTDVTFGPDGICLVSETGAGRVARISASGSDTVLDGLDRPQGILVRDGWLYVVDAGAKTLTGFELATKVRRTLARDLPVGAPPGVTPKPLLGLPPFSGPQGPFAAVAAGPDGTLYLSADAEGSVLALRKEG